jgi:hypothetical protein
MFVTSCPELLQSDLWTHRLAAFTIAEVMYLTSPTPCSICRLAL